MESENNRRLSGRNLENKVAYDLPIDFKLKSVDNRLQAQSGDLNFNRLYYKERTLRNLKRKAKMFGLELVNANRDQLVIAQ